MRYFPALVAVAAAATVAYVLHRAFDEYPSVLFVAAVLVATWFGGLRPGLLATALSLLAVNGLFWREGGSFVYDDLLPQATFTVVGACVSWAVSSLRAAQQRALINERAAHETNDRLQEEVEERRRAEQRAGQSEEQLRLITDAVPVLISYVDADYRYQLANRTYERWFGLAPEQIRGRHVSEVLGEDAWQAVQPHMRQALAGEEVTYEQELPYRGSGPRWVRVTYSPDHGDSGEIRGFVVLVNDISARKQAEMEAERSRGWLERIAETTPDVIFVLDVVNNRNVYSNRSLLQVLGYEPDEFRQIENILERAIAPADLGAARAFYAAMADAKPGDVRVFAHRTLHKDGSIRWIEDRVTPFRWKNGRLTEVLGVASDITERVRSEQALRASEERYRAIVESQTEMVCRFRPDGTILFVNGAYARARGATREALIEEDFWNFVAEEDRPAVRRMLETLRRETPEVRIENRFETAAGPRWTLWTNRGLAFDASGRATEVQSSGIDITERKRSEEELRRAHSLIEGITLGTADLIAALDNEYRYLFFNSAYGAEFRRLWGRDLEVGTSLVETLAPWPDEQRKATGLWGRALRGESFQVTEHFGPDGDPQVYDLRFSPVRDDSGRLVGAAHILRNVTERVRLEEALKESDRRKDEFLALLGHELRNPLAAVVNGIHVLNTIGAQDEQTRRVRQVVERQAQHMTHLIDDLLDVTRISRGKIALRRERLDLGELISKTAEDQQASFAENGCELSVQVPEGPLWVEGDPTRLAQVVGNLLQNACKFTDSGGRVVLTAGPVEDGQVRVSVRDNGVGMDRALIERLFVPFSQADSSLDRSRGGLGLGLSLVKGLVELHGGTISASSAGPAQGSEFTFRLPRAGEGIASAPEQSYRRTDEEHVLFRILVVEDSAPVAEVFSILLRDMGHEVEIVPSGQAALERLEEFQPDVLFSDISMPRMSGYELAERIRSRPEFSDVVLVAMTGYGQSEDRERALRAGFDHHLVKPAEPEQLRRLFKSISANRRQSV